MEQMLEEFVGLDHDAGFLWLLSAVADYRITGNKRSCINALHAANILAGRFNPAEDLSVRGDVKEAVKKAAG